VEPPLELSGKDVQLTDSVFALPLTSIVRHVHETLLRRVGERARDSRPVAEAGSAQEGHNPVSHDKELPSFASRC